MRKRALALIVVVFCVVCDCHGWASWYVKGSNLVCFGDAVSSGSGAVEYNAYPRAFGTTCLTFTVSLAYGPITNLLNPTSIRLGQFVQSGSTGFYFQSWYFSGGAFSRSGQDGTYIAVGIAQTSDWEAAVSGTNRTTEVDVEPVVHWQMVQTIAIFFGVGVVMFLVLGVRRF